MENYTDYFVNHRVSPVRFSEQVAAMNSAGIDTCMEFDSGKTACTLAKNNDRSLTAMNVECAQTLQKTASAMMSASGEAAR